LGINGSASQKDIILVFLAILMVPGRAASWLKDSKNSYQKLKKMVLLLRAAGL